MSWRLHDRDDTWAQWVNDDTGAQVELQRDQGTGEWHVVWYETGSRAGGQDVVSTHGSRDAAKSAAKRLMSERAGSRAPEYNVDVNAESARTPSGWRLVSSSPDSARWRGPGGRSVGVEGAPPTEGMGYYITKNDEEVAAEYNADSAVERAVSLMGGGGPGSVPDSRGEGGVPRDFDFGGGF